MQGILYEEPSAWLFALVTVVGGGWVAWMTGRAVALAWGPGWGAALWSMPLAGAVRFVHFALFGGTLLSPRFFLVDLAVVAGIALLSHRIHRVRQMTRQYRWLYEPAGPLAWRERRQEDALAGRGTR